ncbi:hypothetical protein Corgl_0755 [Coriobacterium glomerans PW2]|uniref:Cell division protein FtsL n=2 Tax=Coriobacterium TaxID=33870 RepID=F2NBR0_CORGP|nr:hypothetical protein Corgl_0755 [Coriobacterium glomerans PW2]
MGYYTSNAAYAYDMQAQPQFEQDPRPQRGSAPEGRPRFDVYTGEGLEANQAVSPVFTHVVKVFCVLMVLFCALGGVRVALASLTASSLDANARLSSKLEDARQQSSTLEVMKAVYGSDTRIRDLATATFGMVPCNEGVDLDLSGSSGHSPE